MRRAGKLLAQVHRGVFEMMRPGITTIEIDRAVEAAIIQAGANPAFKGYGPDSNPFPACTCISIDEEVVHGVPSDRALKSGQIVGIDIGLEINGYYADMAVSHLIGEVSESVRKLWKVTRESLYKGIDQARVGNRINDIGGAVQDWAERHQYQVIRDLIGHGIGGNLHEEPAVPNFRSNDGKVKLRAGMTLAIEPMVSMKDWRIQTLKDGWTTITRDGLPSAHFEHTILITNDKPRILTLLEDGSDPWTIAAELS